jgi:serine/threonine-protein kinase
MTNEPTTDDAGFPDREATPVSPTTDLPTAAWPPPAAGIPSAAPPTAPAPPGYELLQVLGRGGVGVVYKARQAGLNRLVALKMLLAGAHADPGQIGRFRREAEAVARIRHPHIVAVYDFGELDSCPYFSLEYLPGGNLAGRLTAGPLPPREAAALVEPLARAVHFAHERGVVHRDLKPANVLLAEDGTPKVADFGLAKMLGGDDGLTSTGAVLGTPGYMAPEQARGGSKAAGPAADLYALGAILYECLTGRPPFQGETPLLTLAQVVIADPAPPFRLQPGTPRDLSAVCMKCLEKDPRRRYPSALALAEDLRRFLAGERTEARPTRRALRPAMWAAGVASAAVICVLLHFLNRWIGADRWIAKPSSLLRQNWLPILFLLGLAGAVVAYVSWPLLGWVWRRFLPERPEDDPVRRVVFAVVAFIYATPAVAFGIYFLAKEFGR